MKSLSLLFHSGQTLAKHEPHQRARAAQLPQKCRGIVHRRGLHPHGEKVRVVAVLEEQRGEKAHQRAHHPRGQTGDSGHQEHLLVLAWGEPARGDAHGRGADQERVQQKTNDAHDGQLTEGSGEDEILHPLCKFSFFIFQIYISKTKLFVLALNTATRNPTHNIFS